MSAEVLQMGIWSVQVCVPEAWSNEEIIAFAAQEYPCGTTDGWTIRQEGDELLRGMPERNPCAERSGYTHVMLDA